MPINSNDAHYNIVASAIKHTLAYQGEQPTLNEIASVLNVSAYYLQQVFKDWGNLSSEQFFEFLSKSYIRTLLKKSLPIAKMHSNGFGALTRCQDSVLRFESLSDEAFLRLGEDETIFWGLAACIYGHCLLVWTSCGLAKIAFLVANDSLAVYEQTQLKAVWPHADVQQSDRVAQQLSDRIFGDVDGSIEIAAAQPNLTLLVRGSAFQRQVWKALTMIPKGHVCSYQALANSIGKPTAVRAVASAVAKNEHAYLIPCHRVISGNGNFNQYRWGVTRKVALLLKESAMSPVWRV